MWAAEKPLRVREVADELNNDRALAFSGTRLARP
jgi:hypothetical protein